MIYSSWDIEHDRLKLVILGYFLPLYQKRNQKNQNFEKMKNIAGDIVITVPKIKIIYDLRFLDTEWDRQNFLSFWVISCSFTRLMTLKIKILKKWRKVLEILPLHTCVLYLKIIWCMVPEIWSVTDRIFLSFWIAFCPFTPLLTWKIKIFKKWKN